MKPEFILYRTRAGLLLLKSFLLKVRVYEEMLETLEMSIFSSIGYNIKAWLRFTLDVMFKGRFHFVFLYTNQARLSDISAKKASD